MKPKILVVDDQEENLYLLKVLLSSNDYEVIEAPDGQTAVQIISQQKPDLILLDIMMPGMDGYEVCRRIKSDDNFKDIPVIFLTAKREVEDKVRGLDIGAHDFITKPFHKEEILARIRSVLTITDLQNRVLKNERLAAIGEIAVTVNHEINNPLSAILGNAELLEMKLAKLNDPAIMNKLKTIQEQALRIKELLKKITSLREASRKTYIQNTQMIDIKE